MRLPVRGSNAIIRTQVPNETEPAIAACAREFADWLVSPYDDDAGNIASYDLFDVLAGSNPSSGDYNCLRYDYQQDPWDSHPNATANGVVAADFTAWLNAVVWD
jgi:hypothetical protein